MTRFGKELALIEIDSELMQRYESKATKKQLKKFKELQKKRKQQVEWNNKVQGQKVHLRNKIKKSKGKEKEFYKKEYDKVSNLKIDLSIIDNQANSILGGKKEFYYNVQDNFGNFYRVQASDLISKKSPGIWIAKKFINRVGTDYNKEIEELKFYYDIKEEKQKRFNLRGFKDLKTKDDTSREISKLKKIIKNEKDPKKLKQEIKVITLLKVMRNLQFNKEIIEQGYSEDPKSIEEGMYDYPEEDEMDRDEGEYPILVDFIEDTMKLSIG